MTLGIEVTARRPLWFDDGRPVRSASAIARLGDDWLIAQDDATAGALLPVAGGGAVRRLRLLPPVDGHDLFSEAAGTKRSKPDLEAAFALPGGAGVVLLGSGSLPNRRRGVLVRTGGDERSVAVADLAPLYAAVTDALDLPPEELNLEGACLAGASLRWFQRGRGEDVPSASVDLDLDALIAVLDGRLPAGAVEPGRVRRYDLGRSGGVVLAVTDAVATADGRILVSAATEDTDDPVADGTVGGSAIALLDDDRVAAVGVLPAGDGPPLKLEGLAVVTTGTDGATLIGVVDQDDPAEPSLVLDLTVRWG